MSSLQGWLFLKSYNSEEDWNIYYIKECFISPSKLLHFCYISVNFLFQLLFCCLASTSVTLTAHAHHDVTTGSFKMVFSYVYKFSWLRIVVGDCAVLTTSQKVHTILLSHVLERDDAAIQQQLPLFEIWF